MDCELERFRVITAALLMLLFKGNRNRMYSSIVLTFLYLFS